MNAQHLVLYDGQCGVCRRIAHWAQGADTYQRLRLLPYQIAEHPLLDDALRAACRDAMHVITADQRVLAGGEASLLVLNALGWEQSTRLLSLPPLSWLVNFGYHAVARNRRLVGRLFPGGGGENAR